MSLDKAIKHGKEKRKPYRGSKSFDPSCRNNSCPRCLSDALYANKKRDESAKSKMHQE
jgi:hypothetical protein